MATFAKGLGLATYLCLRQQSSNATDSYQCDCKLGHIKLQVPTEILGRRVVQALGPYQEHIGRVVLTGPA